MAPKAFALDFRSSGAISRNADAISNMEYYDRNDMEVLRAENTMLKDKIHQMEHDQAIILQLNQLLIEKLAQLTNADIEGI